jgi:hypothetical protein
LRIREVHEHDPEPHDDKADEARLRDADRRERDRHGERDDSERECFVVAAAVALCGPAPFELRQAALDALDERVDDLRLQLSTEFATRLDRGVHVIAVDHGPQSRTHGSVIEKA